MFKAIENEWEFLLADTTIHWNSINDSSEDVYVYEENGNYEHSTGDFRLKSWLCNGETDAQTVWQIGYDLIGLLNGAFCLYAPRMPRQSIERLNFGDSPQEWHSEIEISKQAFNVAQEKLPSLSDRLDSPISPSFKLVRACLKNEKLHALFHFLGMKVTWTSLYQVYESVEHLSPESLKVLSNNENKRFCSMANNFCSSGMSGRHGLQNKGKKTPPKPISLEESRELMRRISHDCIQRLLGKPFESIELPKVAGVVNDLGTADFTGELFPE